jgi:hypothetical protein
LIEIASLPPQDIPDMYKSSIQALLLNFIQQLSSIVPSSTNLKKAYDDSSEEDQLFISRLGLFLGRRDGLGVLVCCFSDSSFSLLFLLFGCLPFPLCWLWWS